LHSTYGGTLIAASDPMGDRDRGDPPRQHPRAELVDAGSGVWEVT
jgi:hypothetical protein